MADTQAQAESDSDVDRGRSAVRDHWRKLRHYTTVSRAFGAFKKEDLDNQVQVRARNPPKPRCSPVFGAGSEDSRIVPRMSDSVEAQDAQVMSSRFAVMYTPGTAAQQQLQASATKDSNVGLLQDVGALIS